MLYAVAQFLMRLMTAVISTPTDAAVQFLRADGGDISDQPGPSLSCKPRGDSSETVMTTSPPLCEQITFIFAATDHTPFE